MVTIMFKKLAESFTQKNKHHTEALTDLRVSVLQNLQHNNSQLIIKTDDCSEVFQSMIVSCNKAANTMILDELFPRPGFKFSNKTLFHCELKEQGNITSFSTYFIDTVHASGMPALLMSYPESIKQEQRRSNFRLALKTGQHLSAKIPGEFQCTLTGIIKDLSHQGTRINIQGSNTKLINKGDKLSGCLLTFDDKKSIQCELTVRSKRSFSNPYHYMQIGAEITDIQLSDKNLLTKYIATQQRQQCRLNASNRL